jgi:hypothetical protein
MEFPCLFVKFVKIACFVCLEALIISTMNPALMVKPLNSFYPCADKS